MDRTRDPAARRFFRVLRIVRRTTAVNVRARLEYPVDFAMDILFGIVWQTSTLAFAAVLVTRFSGLGGFPPGAVLLIVGLRLLAHGLYTAVFGCLATQLPMLIEEGRFERFLLRPMSVLTQVLTSRFQVNALGDLAVGITMSAYAVARAPIRWSPFAVLFFAAAVIGGVLIEAAVQLPFACLLLRSPAGSGIGQWIDEMMATFGNYPLSILPSALRGVFTFVLPVAFVAYLPALVLLDRVPAHGADAWLAPASPLVALALFLLSKRLWNWSLRHYEAVGG